MCAKCRSTYMRYCNTRREKHKAAGKCECGGIPVDGGKTCIRCRDRSIEHNKTMAKLKYDFKQGKSCEMCGEQDWRCLEFDHVDGKTCNIADVSKLWFESEVSKTRILCAVCHQIHTAKTKVRSKYVAPTRRQMARKWANDYKTAKGCEICGYNNKEYPSTLLFDHIDMNTKSFMISTNLDRPLSDLVAEAAKCRVLCFNCDRRHTRVQLGWHDPQPS